MNKTSTIIKGVLSLLVLLYVGWVTIEWTAMRVYVVQNQAMVVINKFGRQLPADLIVVPADDNQYEGVQEGNPQGRADIFSIRSNTQPKLCSRLKCLRVTRQSGTGMKTATSRAETRHRRF